MSAVINQKKTTIIAVLVILMGGGYFGGGVIDGVNAEVAVINEKVDTLEEDVKSTTNDLEQHEEESGHRETNVILPELKENQDIIIKDIAILKNDMEILKNDNAIMIQKLTSLQLCKANDTC